MKNDILSKAICIAGTFVLILLIVIFTAIYSHWGDQNSQALKDSLSTISGIFGGLATLAAAIVAAYLYNDWKEPFIVEKIEIYQKELRGNIRVFKHSIVKFLFLIHYENSAFVQLNNGDHLSLEYKKRLNNVLDNIDDLVSEIKNYRSIVKWKEKPFTKKHLDAINAAEISLENIFIVLNKYDLHKDYIISYKYLLTETKKLDFEKDIRNISEKFNEELTTYFDNFFQKVDSSEQRPLISTNKKIK